MRCCEYSRVCLLINDSLCPDTEPGAVSGTKSKEKDLLIVLSQVLKEIQLWTHEIDSTSENGPEAKPESTSDECQCLSKSIAHLVVLLAVENKFVQHLTVNIFVVICGFIVASGGNMGQFIHLLCYCLEWAISFLSYSSASSTTVAEVSNCDSSSCSGILKPKLKNAKWSTVASIIQVLSNILKYLKQECDDKLLGTYLDSISSFLLNVSWDLLKIPLDCNGEAQESSGVDVLQSTNVQHRELIIVFLGSLVQLLCSLAEQSVLVGAAGGSPDKNPVLCKISSLIPKLLSWCLGKHGDCNNDRISHYFRHKMLMIMIRLSFEVHLEESILVLWLQLLHKYFQDFLLLPLRKTQSGQVDGLEGSPFLLSGSNAGVNGMSSRHLQRQAVFLFLRCAFCLINLREGSDEQCVCAVPNSHLTFDSRSNIECCSKWKGLLELYKWFQGHLPAHMCANYKVYREECMIFSSSFLQLYMHEDDILFEVLLLLLSLPSNVMQLACNRKETLKQMKEDIFFHVANLFNPIHLFHLFLAELSYDHQVLLDYLISKDTGISCAEYLLRCLRTICHSWPLFMEFPMGVEVVYQSFCKKRKILMDGPTSEVDQSAACVKGNGTPVSLEEESKRHYGYGGKHSSRGQPFEEAKECLLTLKHSVENLHLKNLFPYNPEALMRRLTRFQEVCINQQQCHLARNVGSTWKLKPSSSYLS